MKKDLQKEIENFYNEKGFLSKKDIFYLDKKEIRKKKLQKIVSDS